MNEINVWVAWLQDIGWPGFADLAIITLVFYSVLVWLKRTRRAVMVLAGILIVAVVYLLALKFNLTITSGLLHYFFTVFLVALVVIFQEDLRYGFEQIALWWWNRRLPGAARRRPRLPRREVDILARTLFDLARDNIGALVVIRGRDIIARHLTGGEEVRGVLSEPLLKSIFDPNSIGHDGAVIIEGNTVAKLGVHLPLSRNLEKLPRSGTRHAAALGLSEVSDALCLVVSEERGAVSLTRRGDIRTVPDASQLTNILEAFYEESAPRTTDQAWSSFWRKNTREKLIAVMLALLAWLSSERGSQIVQETFPVTVAYSQLPPTLTVVATNPSALRVTFSAPRRAFQLFDERIIKLTLPLRDAQPGQSSVPVSLADLAFPDSLTLQDIEPRQVQFLIETKPPRPNALP